MNPTTIQGAFVLVGTDAEGERRESTHPTLEQATTVGRQYCQHDGSGPAWRHWEVWGNHPKTGEWSPLMCSIIAKFKLGHIVTTPNALTRLTHNDILTAIGRHQAGDWGDVSDDDRQENELSLKEGFRLLSVYHSANGVKFWLITEADRSATTVLLPEDY